MRNFANPRSGRAERLAARPGTSRAAHWACQFISDRAVPKSAPLQNRILAGPRSQCFGREPLHCCGRSQRAGFGRRSARTPKLRRGSCAAKTNQLSGASRLPRKVARMMVPTMWLSPAIAISPVRTKKAIMHLTNRNRSANVRIVGGGYVHQSHRSGFPQRRCSPRLF